MYRTIDYLDLATDTSCLESPDQAGEVRRWQSAVEEVSSSEDKRPSVSFLLAHDSLLELGEGDQELEHGAGHLLLPRPMSLASSPAPHTR